MDPTEKRNLFYEIALMMLGMMTGIIIGSALQYSSGAGSVLYALLIALAFTAYIARKYRVLS